jgi:hypothetical protein
VIWPKATVGFATDQELKPTIPFSGRLLQRGFVRLLRASGQDAQTPLEKARPLP